MGNGSKQLHRLLLFAFVLQTASAANWPQWRGPTGCGISTETNLPLKWSATENVAWSVSLPDRGNSTPVIWEDRIFLTQAVEREKKRGLLCLDARTGAQLWFYTLEYSGAEDSHEANPYCSSSAVTDGERVIAWFGSAGVFCWDKDGKLLWKKELGPQSHQWGYGSSPVLHGDLCLLQFGPGERSFLTALNKKTGEAVWKEETPEIVPEQRTDGFAGRRGVIGSWSTPILIQVEGREEMIVTLPEEVRSYDPVKGEMYWKCAGLNPLIYPSPIHQEGIVVAMGGFRGSSLAVRAGGRGDITGSRRLWQQTRTADRLGSGVIRGEHIYILNTPGIAECIELNTGKAVWNERLPAQGANRESWSSMVLAGDRIYVLNQSGETIVLRASPQYEALQANPLDGELTNASLAVANGRFYIRTHTKLWCIGEKGSPTPP